VHHALRVHVGQALCHLHGRAQDAVHLRAAVRRQVVALPQRHPQRPCAPGHRLFARCCCRDGSSTKPFVQAEWPSARGDVQFKQCYSGEPVRIMLKSRRQEPLSTACNAAAQVCQGGGAHGGLRGTQGEAGTTCVAELHDKEAAEGDHAVGAQAAQILAQAWLADRLAACTRLRAAAPPSTTAAHTTRSAGQKPYTWGAASSNACNHHSVIGSLPVTYGMRLGVAQLVVSDCGAGEGSPPLQR
jgi:hypothetical protein